MKKIRVAYFQQKLFIDFFDRNFGKGLLGYWLKADYLKWNLKSLVYCNYGWGNVGVSALKVLVDGA